MPRAWGIARRSSAPPGLGVTGWGWGHGCSEDPEPLGRTHTRARTLHGGDTWPRCHDEGSSVAREGKVQLRPLGLESAGSGRQRGCR